MTFDIKDFYLNMTMKLNDYMTIKLSDVPEEFIKQYKLAAKTIKEGYVYIQTFKGMYGLPQAGILVQKLL